MYVIYEGLITPNLPFPSSKNSQPGIFTLPTDCLYLNIYNISPHRLEFSFSGGNPDWYFPPNSEAEGIYIGVQGGAELNIAPKMQGQVNLQLLNIFTTVPQQGISGVLAIMGFKEGEIWQGKRPLITGAVTPNFGGLGVASTLSNEGNPAGTLVIDIGDAAHPNLIKINNDGSFSWSVDQSGTPHQILLSETSGNPLKIGQAGDITEVLGRLVVDGKIQTDGGGLATDGIGNLTCNNINVANVDCGPITQLNSQPTVGNGVPIEVARIPHTNVISTAPINLIIFNTGTTGLYRINGHFSHVVATGGGCTILITYHNPDIGASSFFMTTNQGVVLNAAILGANAYALISNCFYADMISSIVVQFTDSAGVPNDWLSFSLEFLG